jgi:hypothetical protein
MEKIFRRALGFFVVSLQKEPWRLQGIGNRATVGPISIIPHDA